jgi:hypothetical protein
MRFSIVSALAFLASSVIAAPAGASDLSLRVAEAAPAPPAGPPAPPPNSGEIITDLGPSVKNVLTVTGKDSRQLLVQLSPEVAALVTSLGLPTGGVPLGSIVNTAASVGDLLRSLGPNTSNLVVVVGEDASFLLIELAPSLAALVGGLLPPLAVPVGAVVTTVGEHVKRAQGSGQLLADIGQQVDGVLTVTGPQAQLLLIRLSPEVAALVGGLGLGPVGTAVGTVLASASSVGALLTALGPNVDGLLIVVEHGTQFLLVSLSPVVAGLLSGLGLPQLGVPVGAVVDTIAANV